MLREGKRAQTRANNLKLLSQVFNYARRQRWCAENPCWGVRRPQIRPHQDIRFFDKDELEAVLSAIDVPRKPFGAIDKAIILTAAMTGMRQGELLALRWRDVDWDAKRIRVRRNYVRGYRGTPKSRSGERSIGLATRVGAQLKELRQGSRFVADGDLVFGSPITGEPLDHASLLRRFRKALQDAGGTADLGISVVDHFDPITGTSTGAIIALGLGAGLTPTQITSFYVEHGEKMFPARHRGRARRAFTSKFSPAPLEIGGEGLPHPLLQLLLADLALVEASPTDQVDVVLVAPQRLDDGAEQEGTQGRRAAGGEVLPAHDDVERLPAPGQQVAAVQARAPVGGIGRSPSAEDADLGERLPEAADRLNDADHARKF